MLPIVVTALVSLMIPQSHVSGFSLDSQICLLAVQTVVGDNITGNESSRVQVILRGMFQITGQYVYNTIYC